ncbi:DUF1003 domain-containing protein [Niabella ginsengisoli]|uniref:DUF1003 domain-containing protein n=1 Tax=Niabella ginsengisoli TaxID=522298 RepID=A0ABS9SK85_9BACT|nr:hypothetical protein [Niabella ginsengisoli]MCH5598786.1 hypothetical protein [Niabella ginsengisoli]
MMDQKENNILGERNKARLERIANVATRWIGSTASLLVHTVLFIIAFALPLLHILSFDKMLLVLTTIVSLEAIYLAIFIQMSVNKNSEDIEEIQEYVEEIQEDIEEIQEDVDEIQEDVEEIQEDVEEIQEDVEEIQEDVEEIQEELDEDAEDGLVSQKTEAVQVFNSVDKISKIQLLINQLQKEIEQLKAQKIS